MQSDIIKIISRGKCGWSAQGLTKEGNSFSSSGGSCEEYAKDAPDGTPVVDAIDADYGAFAKLIMAGPMLDVSLPAETVSRFGKKEQETLAKMMPGLGGTFATIGALNLIGFSSLDSVSLDIHLEMKRKIPGMKFGTVKGGEVEWETETLPQCPTGCDHRNSGCTLSCYDEEYVPST